MTYSWSDAASTTFGADEDAYAYCYTCSRVTMQGAELRAGRVWGTCEGCFEVVDITDTIACDWCPGPGCAGVPC